MQIGWRQHTEAVKLKLHNGNEIPAYIIHYKAGQRFPDLPPAGRVISIKTVNDIGEKEVLHYLPIYAGFDIETTNVIDGDTKLGFMYHWQLSICNDDWGIVFLGREWEAYTDCVEQIQSFYHLDASTRIIVWVANLGFEYTFLKNRFKWIIDRFFAKEERHPLNAPTVGGIDYREALSISGGSLAQLAKDYTYTQKLVGDLDYSKLRSSQTPLEKDTEERYCINDVTILAEWSSFVFDKYIKPDKKIPLTKTGLLRSEMKRELKESTTYKQRQEYNQLVYDAFPDETTYKFWFRYLFRGGYTHGNILNCGYTIEDKNTPEDAGADGFDITSSYPAQMNVAYYPVTPFEPIYDYDLEQLIKTKCVIMIAEFDNIKRKTSISYESKHKAIELPYKYIETRRGLKKVIDGIIDNGRIAELNGTLKVCITEIDYKIYKELYSWDGPVRIKAIWIAERGRMPSFVTAVLNRHYKNKALMKKQGLKDSPEYAIEKSGVNASYGLLVTRVQLSKVTIDSNGNWVTIENSVDFEKERKKAFLLPQIGIWVTAQARLALFLPMFEIIKRLGDRYIIYNDTDSIKVRAHPLIFEIIKKYNDWMSKRIKAVGLTEPEFDDLGQYEHEAHYTKIKVLGAKRYLVEENGKVKATIAGMPKNALLNIKGDAFEAFSEWGMSLEAGISEKRTIHYEDSPSDWIAPDGVMMHEESSACIYEIAFSMTLDEYYKTMIQDSIKNEKMRKLGGF